MAGIFGAIKKRFGVNKEKEPEQALDQATYEAIATLKEKLAADPSTDFSSEFSTVVKDFFRSLLKLKYHFTHEELVSEIARRRFVPEIKKEMTEYLQKLTHQQYSPEGFKKEHLITHMNLFEELVAKATSESARPYKKKQGKKDDKGKTAKPAPMKSQALLKKRQLEKAKQDAPRPSIHLPFGSIFHKKEGDEKQEQDISPTPAGDEGLFAPPGIIEGKEALTKGGNDLDNAMGLADEMQYQNPSKNKTKFKSQPKSKKTLEVPAEKPSESSISQLPEPQGETLSEIYALFKKAYDSLGKKQAEDTKEILKEIKSLNSKLDRKDRQHFKEEIDNLTKEIKLLQKELAEKAKEPSDKKNSSELKQQGIPATSEPLGPVPLPTLEFEENAELPALPSGSLASKPKQEQELSQKKPLGIFSIFKAKQPKIEEGQVLPQAPAIPDEEPLPAPQIAPPEKPESEAFASKQGKRKKQPLAKAVSAKDAAPEKKPGDDVTQIYNLFKSAYDSLNSNMIGDAGEDLAKIREISTKLDKKDQAHFREEILHLSQKIIYLQKEGARKAKKEKAKERAALKEQGLSITPLPILAKKKTPEKPLIQEEAKAPISAPAQSVPKRRFFLFGKKEPALESEPASIQAEPVIAPIPEPQPAIAAPSLEQGPVSGIKKPAKDRPILDKPGKTPKKGKEKSKKEKEPARLDVQTTPDSVDLLTPPSLEFEEVGAPLMAGQDTIHPEPKPASAAKKSLFSLFAKKEPKPKQAPEPDSLPNPLFAQEVGLPELPAFPEPGKTPLASEPELSPDLSLNPSSNLSQNLSPKASKPKSAWHSKKKEPQSISMKAEDAKEDKADKISLLEKEAGIDYISGAEPPSFEEQVDVQKHTIQKKPFAPKQTVPVSSDSIPAGPEQELHPSGLKSMEAEEAIAPPLIEAQLQSGKSSRHGKQKKAVPPKTPPPPPPKIPDLLDKAPAAAPEQLPYPRKFTFMPQPDMGAEVMHEPIRLETPPFEEYGMMPAELTPLEDKLHAEISAQEGKEERKKPGASFMGRFMAKKSAPEKPHIPIQESILQSRPEELPEPGLFPVAPEGLPAQRLVPISEDERLILTQISDNVKKMRFAIGAEDISGAEKIWGQIADLRAALSPSLNNMMEPVVRDIGSALEIIQIEFLQSKQAVPSFLTVPSSSTHDTWGNNEDHNQRILRSVGGVPVSSGSNGSQRLSGISFHSLQASMPSSRPTQPKLTKKEAEQQKAAQTILDFNQALDSAKTHLRASRLGEAKDAYQRAMNLKRLLKVDEAEKNRLTYELMDLNVALRMAKVK